MKKRVEKGPAKGKPKPKVTVASPPPTPLDPKSLAKPPAAPERDVGAPSQPKRSMSLRVDDVDEFVYSPSGAEQPPAPLPPLASVSILQPPARKISVGSDVVEVESVGSFASNPTSSPSKKKKKPLATGERRQSVSFKFPAEDDDAAPAPGKEGQLNDHLTQFRFGESPVNEADPMSDASPAALPPWQRPTSQGVASQGVVSASDIEFGRQVDEESIDIDDKFGDVQRERSSSGGSSRRGSAVPLRIPKWVRNMRPYVEEKVLHQIDDIDEISRPTYRTAYTDFLSRWPLLVVFLSLLIPIVFTAVAALRPAAFNTGRADFRALYHPAVLATEASKAIRLEWSIRQETTATAGSTHERTLPKYRFFIQFLAKDPNQNLFNETILRFIQTVEMAVKRAEYYKYLCWTNNLKLQTPRATYPSCAPVASVTTYFFPGLLVPSPDGFVEFEYTGEGKDFQGQGSDMEKIITMMMQNGRYRWFVDGTMDKTHYSTSALRTQFTLGFPVLSDGEEISLTHYNKLVNKLLVEVVDIVQGFSHPDLSITLGGDRIIDAIVDEVLDMQLMITAAAVAVVFVLLAFHMRSLLLPSAAVVQMAVTYVSAYFIYTMIAGVSDLTIISASAMVVTLTHSCHSVLAITESFHHSGFLGTTGRKNQLSMEERISAVFHTTLPSIALSHVVSVLAFLCTLLSPTPAMNHFGIVMVCAVVIDLILDCTYFPAVIIFYNFNFNRRSRTVLKQVQPSCSFEFYERSKALTCLLQADEATKMFYDEPNMMETRITLDTGGDFSPSKSATMRDPMQRRMTMLLTQSQSGVDPAMTMSFVPGETPNLDSSPSKKTYLSPRMVPLECIFQVNPQLTVPATARGSIKGAMASYNRRLMTEGGKAAEQLVAVRRQDNKTIGEIAMFSIQAHRTKWEYIGRFLGTLRADDYSPYVTEQLCEAVHGDFLLWTDERSELMERNDDNVDLLEKIPPPLSKDRTKHRCWESRMVGYSREEKDGRMLNRRTLHQGYGWLERFLSEYLARVTRLVRYPVVATGVLAAIVLFAFATQFEGMRGDTPIIETSPVIADFEYASTKFAAGGYCDYCAAFQRPPTELPQLSISAIQKCADDGFGILTRAFVDRCDTCMGNNSCLDCANRPWGISVMDKCDICAAGDEVNRCMDCSRNKNSRNGTCWYCYEQYGKVGYGGAACDKKCDTTVCPPSLGKCNQWTGECECHASFERGFFEDDPANSSTHCSKCLDGFTPEVDSMLPNICTIECSNTSECTCVAGRCISCGEFAVGPSCQHKNQRTCSAGTLNADGSCNCPQGLHNGICVNSRECSYHGNYYPAASVTPGCKCRGQWVGPQCQHCRCYNGGTCDEVDGTCLCNEGWTGFDCSTCVFTCLSRGRCPDAWNELQYNRSTCIALFCNESDWENDRVCPRCFRNSTETCRRIRDNVTCNDNFKCQWNFTSQKCEGFWYTEPFSAAQAGCYNCVGAWEGKQCDICAGAVYNLTCTEGGVVVGCDNEPTSIGMPWKIVDRCGVCNGNGVCLGCEGILGSPSLLDSCGVCGGLEGCHTGVDESIVVEYIWGVKPNRDFRNGTYHLVEQDKEMNISNPGFQLFLLQKCEELLNLTAIDAAHSRCVFLELQEWLEAQNRSLPSATIHSDLFDFAFAQNRFVDVSFTSMNATTATVLWFKFSLRTYISVNEGTAKLLDWFRWFDDIRIDMQQHENNTGTIVHSSNEWSVAVAVQSAETLVYYAVFFSSAVFLLGAFALTFDYILVLTSFFAVMCVVASSLFVYYLLNWELGPIEQIAFAIGVASSAEYTLHLTTTYLEPLPAARIDVADEDPSVVRLETLKIAYLRIGTAIITSAVTSIFAAFTLVFSIVRLFARLGAIILVTQGIAIFFLFALAAATQIFGPMARYHVYYGRTVLLSVVAFSCCLFILIMAMGGVFPTVDNGFIEL